MKIAEIIKSNDLLNEGLILLLKKEVKEIKENVLALIDLKSARAEVSENKEEKTYWDKSQFETEEKIRNMEEKIKEILKILPDKNFDKRSILYDVSEILEKGEITLKFEKGIEKKFKGLEEYFSFDNPEMWFLAEE